MMPSGFFEGCRLGNVKASRRPEYPFEAGAFEPVESVDDKATLWKDNLITLPMAVVLPTGYESVSRIRDAMAHAACGAGERREKRGCRRVC